MTHNVLDNETEIIYKTEILEQSVETLKTTSIKAEIKRSLY